MKKNVKILFVLLAALFLLPHLCLAGSKDYNGIIVYSGGMFSWGKIRTAEAEFFTNFDPTATPVYNEAGGTDLVAGSVPVVLYNEALVFQVNIPVLGSSGIEIIIEGQAGNSGAWGHIVTKSYSAPTTEIFVVREPVGRVRSSVKSTGTDGVDDVTLTALFRGIK